MALCERINITIYLKKTFWPVTCITIYGIEVDFTDMVNRLPEDKLEKCSNLVRQFRIRKNGYFTEILIFNWSIQLCACLVVVPRRAFLYAV